MVKRTPIILEFNGIPGTGKSTIVDALKIALEKDGYSVKKGYSQWIWERYHYPIMIVPFSIQLYRLVCKFADSVKPFRKRTHQSGVLYYSRVYYKARKYCDSDFLLIDQGILQDLNTIAWLDELLPLNRGKLVAAISYIKKMNICFHRIDCINNIELSMDRIRTRPPKNHEFEHISSEELRKALITQANNFDYIRNVFNEVFTNQRVISVDTELSPEETAQRIKEFAYLLMNNTNNYH